MRTLFFDCSMGAAGDMLTAALIELIADPEAFITELNGLGIPGACFSREQVEKYGVTGTQITVKVLGREEGHRHTFRSIFYRQHRRGMKEIHNIITNLPISDDVKCNVLAVYDLIARAESHAHGVPVSDIHFHEVGTLDAIADITAVCMLIERINPERIVVSPIHVGSGFVRCAHGVLPVPAPATAHILQDVPTYGGAVSGELCTPTGAAILRHFANSFGDMPNLEATAVGIGMGKKDFQRANCLRALLG